jgi:hypothetical protein
MDAGWAALCADGDVAGDFSLNQPNRRTVLECPDASRCIGMTPL